MGAVDVGACRRRGARCRPLQQRGHEPGRLVHVPSGASVLDYTAELTGQGPMVRAGARNLAGRVVRAIRSGGVASDFPNP